MTVIEAIANIYSEVFSARVAELEAGWQEPWQAPAPGYEQGLGGNAYQGTNAVLTNFVRAARHYELPVWITDRQVKENGLWVEDFKYIPIIKYSEQYRSRKAGADGRYETLSAKEYALLPESRRNVYVFSQSVRFFKALNICQTNLKELHPDIYAALCEHFGVGKTAAAQCPSIDALLAAGATPDGCRIRQGDYAEPLYRPDLDIMLVPSEGNCRSLGEFYTMFLHELAAATGHPSRLDRKVDAASAASKAREALVCELSAATLCGTLGVSSSLSANSARYLKEWAAIAGSPDSIKEVVYDAAKASEYVMNGLGLKPAIGYDLQARLAEVQAASQGEKTGKAEMKVPTFLGVKRKGDGVSVTRKKTNKH